VTKSEVGYLSNATDIKTCDTKKMNEKLQKVPRNERKSIKIKEYFDVAVKRI